MQEFVVWITLHPSPLWNRVQGNFSAGKINKSGKSLLFFLCNESAVYDNTMFEKKRIQQYTWHHPGAKN